MLNAVIFDMDGVLVDAKEWHYEALNKALGEYGYTITHEEHLQKFDGLPTRDKLKMLSREKGLPEDLHAVINKRKQEYTIEIINEKCVPVPHIKKALSVLKEKGYKTGLASNSIRKSIITMMEMSGLIEYFDVIISNEDVTNAKPDPEIYLKAAAAVGEKPENCLVLEDNEYGIQAAVASGAHVMKVGSTKDVTIDNITKRIREIDGEE